MVTIIFLKVEDKFGPTVNASAKGLLLSVTCQMTGEAKPDLPFVVTLQSASFHVIQYPSFHSLLSHPPPVREIGSRLVDFNAPEY